MPRPKKPVKDYTGRGRKNTQFLTPKPRKYSGHASDSDEFWSPRPQQIPARSTAKKAVKKTVRRKRK